MAQPARKHESGAPTVEAVRPKMEALAGFVLQMSDDEIWNFIDALLPDMDAGEKEDLWGAVLIVKRRHEPTRPFKEYLAERARKAS